MRVWQKGESMKPEAQRIAIAEACGWDFDPKQAHEWKSRGRWVSGPNGIPAMVFRHSIPDYLNDLNAMHDAEVLHKLHHYPLREAYYPKLITICDAEKATDFPLWMATAAQRAEAFLRTINKWEETK